MKTTERKREIEQLLFRWSMQIETLNKAGSLDINRDSEHLACRILNLIFDINLVNLNIDFANMPGIDLADEDEGIYFQVSKKYSVEKIKKTFKTVQQHFGKPLKIRFYFITESVLPKINPNTFKEYSEVFDPKKDIITHERILNLTSEFPGKQKLLISLLKEEFEETSEYSNTFDKEVDYIINRISGYKNSFVSMKPHNEGSNALKLLANNALNGIRNGQDDYLDREYFDFINGLLYLINELTEKANLLGEPKVSEVARKLTMLEPSVFEYASLVDDEMLKKSNFYPNKAQQKFIDLYRPVKHLLCV